MHGLWTNDPNSASFRKGRARNGRRNRPTLFFSLFLQFAGVSQTPSSYSFSFLLLKSSSSRFSSSSSHFSPCRLRAQRTAMIGSILFLFSSWNENHESETQSAARRHGGPEGCRHRRQGHPNPLDDTVGPQLFPARPQVPRHLHSAVDLERSIAARTLPSFYCWHQRTVAACIVDTHHRYLSQSQFLVYG